MEAIGNWPQTSGGILPLQEGEPPGHLRIEPAPSIFPTMDDPDLPEPKDFSELGGEALNESKGHSKKNRANAPESKSLAGCLLVAHPELMDPNFRRTVLLLSEHQKPKGAFGLILNRPTGQTVGELLAGQTVGKLGRVEVFLGGPVAVDQMSFAAFHWNPVLGRMECGHHLGLEEAEESLIRENTVLRAYIGYSGWAPGQLEGELRHRSWVVAKPRPAVLDPRNAAVLWRDVLVPLGPEFRLQAEAPEHLGLN